MSEKVSCSKCRQQDLFLLESDFGAEYETKTAAEYVCDECRVKPESGDGPSEEVEVCDLCEGTGVVECDMGHDHDCGECA